MRRTGAAALLLAVAIPVLRADDSKKVESNPPKVELDALKAAYANERAAAQKEALAAEKSLQQKIFSEKLAVLFKSYPPKFFEFAKANAANDSGFDALMFVAQTFPGKPAGEALDIVVEKYEERVSSNPALLERVGEKGEKIIRTLRDKKTEAEANIKLTVSLANILKSPTERADTDAAIAAALPKAKEAEKLYEEAISMSKDVKNVSREIGIAKANLQELQKLGIGKTMPDIVTKDLDDNAVKISDYRGKVVVMQVGASTSPSTVAMIPHLRGLARRMEGKPLVVISVNCDEKLETLNKFLEKEEMPWTHWFDGKGGPLSKGFNLKIYPTVYVLDSKGVIRYRGSRGEKLDVAVEKLVKEMESAE